MKPFFLSAGKRVAGNSKRRSARCGLKSSVVPHYFDVETLEERRVPNADIAGDTLGAAFSVGALSGQQPYSSHVGVASPDDFYVFTLSARSTFNATAAGTGFAPGVQIIQDANSNGLVDSGEIKASIPANCGGFTTQKYAQSAGAILSPGTYYVRVFQSGCDSDYTLTLLSDTAGGKLLGARDVGTLTSPSTTTVKDYVGAGDSTDLHKFKLVALTPITIKLSGMSADANLYLLNSVGGVLASSANGGSADETISTVLGPGTYYVKVIANVGSTNYTLDLTV